MQHETMSAGTKHWRTTLWNGMATGIENVGTAEQQGHPFCNVCLQKEGLLIEITQALEAIAIGGPRKPLQCPNCKAKYVKVRAYD
jgi:hypothetical protein